MKFQPPALKSVIPFPCCCAECGLIKAPAIRAYNYDSHSHAQYCLGCYSSIVETGIFDRPQPLTLMK